MGRPMSPLPIPHVDSDSVDGARQATHHLQALGRTRIATIAGLGHLCAGGSPAGLPAGAGRSGHRRPRQLQHGLRGGHRVARGAGCGRRVRGQRPDGGRRAAGAARRRSPGPGRRGPASLRRPGRHRTHRRTTARPASTSRCGPWRGRWSPRCCGRSPATARGGVGGPAERAGGALFGVSARRGRKLQDRTQKTCRRDTARRRAQPTSCRAPRHGSPAHNAARPEW